MATKATKISRFVVAVDDRPIYVGLDAHKKTYSVALFEPTDGVVETYICPADAGALADQLVNLGCQIAHVVYESGPTGFALARTLKRNGFSVSVIAASRIPCGYVAAAKTDRLDAVALLCESGEGFTACIQHDCVRDEQLGPDEVQDHELVDLQ